MTILTPPKVLREKLGEEGTDALIELVNKANEKQKEDVLTFVEEKFERRLTEVKSDLEIKISEVKSYLETKISEVKSEVAHSKSDMIKWMFIFWAGQTTVLASLLFAFFK
ncbi:MAG: hypothetical protein AB1546_16010 [bacterium]